MDNLLSIAKLIARTRIISFGHYILSNGIHTPYYLDFTLLSNKPNYLNMLIEQVSLYLDNKKIFDRIDKIVGILDKGVIIAVPLAMKKMKPFALFSLKTGDISVGTVDVNEEILLVDDMLSTGKTICKVIEGLEKKYGSKVRNVFILLDREEGGTVKLRERGINIYRLIEISKIAKTLSSYGLISDEEYEIILNHIKEVGRTR